MTYRDFWKLTAIHQLNALVAAAIDPAAIRQAATFADYALRRDPHNLGESRSGKGRLWFWDMLGIYFTVDEATMTVDVLLVGPSASR